MTVTTPTPPPPRGIRTRHAGTEFRSRLEARWAAFFTLAGWRWTYEPFDADGYIPDFLIHGSKNLLVEIGPCEYLSEFSAKAAKARQAFPDRPVLVLGVDPLILLDVGWQTAAGYLTDDGWKSGPDVASWARCSFVTDPVGRRVCNAIGVFHQSGSYQLLPCGHHDGDHHLRGDLTPDFIAELWAEAGNRVQWRRR